MQPILDALSANNFYPTAIEADGKIHRFNRNQDDKKKCAWYVAYQNHTRVGGELFYVVVYGDWRESDSYTYTSQNNFSKDDNAYIKKQIESASKEREREQERIYEEISKECTAIWGACGDANGDNAYLVAKKVKPFGIKEHEGNLVVPIRDKEGKQWSLQHISVGRKSFYPGGRVKGCYHVIGSNPAYLCEGYSTAASIHMATGHGVLVCFNASNMIEISRQFPGLIVCADNDLWVKEPVDNPGLTAAKKCNASKILIPQFSNLDTKPTDFNDLHCLEGLDAVRSQILDNDIPSEFVLTLGHKDKTYYYMSSSNGQVVNMTRAEHTRAVFRDLMPEAYWEARYPKDKGGCDWDKVADTLMNASRQRGVFNDELVRGVGVWKDGSKYVMHLGRKLYFDGKLHDLAALKGRYIYEVGPECSTPTAPGSTNTLMDILDNISFKEPKAKILLGGWLCIAPIAGALPWRPHIWLTGGAGTGKTTILGDVVHPLLRRHAHFFQGQTTEAGIRQTCKADSLAVVFDEMEAEDERSLGRVAGIVELLRQASSDSEGRVVKGSPSGHAVSYKPSFSALVSAIRPNLPHEADRSRVTILELTKGTPEQYDRFKVGVSSLTQEYIDGIFARTFSLLPELEATIRVFWDVLRLKYNARIGQQYGTLVAGYHMLSWDTPPTRAEAELFCEQFNFSEIKVIEQEEIECIHYLADKIVPIGSGASKSISELLQHDNENAEEVLNRYGIRSEADFVWVAASNPELSKLYRGTKWANNWSKSLARIKDSVKGSVKINKKTCWAVKVPKEVIFNSD